MTCRHYEHCFLELGFPPPVLAMHRPQVGPWDYKESGLSHQPYGRCSWCWPSCKLQPVKTPDSSAGATAPQPASKLPEVGRSVGEAVSQVVLVSQQGHYKRAGCREQLGWGDHRLVQFKRKDELKLIFIWEGQTWRNRANKCSQLYSCFLQESSRACVQGRLWEVESAKPIWKADSRQRE